VALSKKHCCHSEMGYAMSRQPDSKEAGICSRTRSCAVMHYCVVGTLFAGDPGHAPILASLQLLTSVWVRDSQHVKVARIRDILPSL
jgi:hypothetical protein